VSNRSIEISKPDGDVIGVGIDGNGNIIGKEITIQGNIIQLINPSSEAVAQFSEIASIGTEVTTFASGGTLQSSATPREPDKIEKTITELLALLKSSVAKEGELQAGAVQFSRVDLLLKKSILIKTEADQMYFDHIGGKASKQTHQYSADLSGKTQIDLSKLLQGFDDNKHTAKLREAYDLLQEANQIDPANAVVLLHMAQLLIELTPDDPTDEQQLLYRVQKLLHSPQNDTDRFHLAQATFLIATSGDQIHVDSLRDVRDCFLKLGKNEWVRQCDDLLGSYNSSPPPVMNDGQQDPPIINSSQQYQQSVAAFQPVGRWLMRVSDAAGSVLHATMYPDGSFEALQQTNFFTVQAAGQWIFNPYSKLLQFQGLIGGVQPFMLGIIIQGQQGNGFLALGTDSYTYLLTRE